MIFGRAPTDAELRAGVEYLAAEPMKAFEERKNAKAAKDAEKTKDTKDTKSATESTAPKEAGAESVPAADEGRGGEREGDSYGMMAGVVPGAAKKDDDKKLLPVTPLGRYLKVLLSSSEFLFVS
jgi:hypothetical protein